MVQETLIFSASLHKEELKQTKHFNLPQFPALQKFVKVIFIVLFLFGSFVTASNYAFSSGSGYSNQQQYSYPKQNVYIVPSSTNELQSIDQELARAKNALQQQTAACQQQLHSSYQQNKVTFIDNNRHYQPQNTYSQQCSQWMQPTINYIHELETRKQQLAGNYPYQTKYQIPVNYQYQTNYQTPVNYQIPVATDNISDELRWSLQYSYDKIQRYESELQYAQQQLIYQQNVCATQGNPPKCIEWMQPTIKYIDYLQSGLASAKEYVATDLLPAARQ